MPRYPNNYMGGVFRATEPYIYLVDMVVTRGIAGFGATEPYIYFYRCYASVAKEYYEGYASKWVKDGQGGIVQGSMNDLKNYHIPRLQRQGYVNVPTTAEEFHSKNAACELKDWYQVSGPTAEPEPEPEPPKETPMQVYVCKYYNPNTNAWQTVLSTSYDKLYADMSEYETAPMTEIEITTYIQQQAGAGATVSINYIKQVSAPTTEPQITPTPIHELPEEEETIEEPGMACPATVVIMAIGIILSIIYLVGV